MNGKMIKIRSRISRISKRLHNRSRRLRKKNLYTLWLAIKWPLVIGLWLFAFILGIIGFSKVSTSTGDGSTVYDFFYRSMQLIVLQSGDVGVRVPWELETARFLMPVLAAYATIQALLAIFNRQWQLLKVQFFKNHVVICGLGERGLRLTQAFSENAYRVIIIEEDRENPLIEHSRKYRPVIMNGDATDRDQLNKARIHKAKYLVAVCTDDGTNVDIALKSRQIMHSGKGGNLTTFVHIVDLELCNLLRTWELVSEDDTFKLEFVNIFERGARLMLDMYPPFHNKAEIDERVPRILIIGLGKMGRSLIVQAARDWWLEEHRRDKSLRIAVIDVAAHSKIELLRLQYSKLDRACSFDIWEMEKNAPGIERSDFLYNKQGEFDVDSIYICFDDDIHVLVNALTIYRKTREHKIPIVVRMSQDAGLSKMIMEDRDALDLEQIHTFGLLDETCNLEVLLGGTHEIIARAIYEYTRHKLAPATPSETKQIMVPWENLPPDVKDSKRDLAVNIERKLKAINCKIQPLTDLEASSFKFLPEETEQLIKMDYERSTIDALPVCLAKAGFQISRGN